MRSWLIVGQPATTSPEGEAPAGTVAGTREAGRGERFLDVAGGVGIGGAEPVQRVDDLSGQLVSAQRQQIARHVGVAA